jgi:RNA polymerase sigma-70 factor, ECF subfamily
MGTTATARTLSPEGAGFDTVDDHFAAAYRSGLTQLVGFFRAKGIGREESADLANETMVRMLVHLKRHGRERTDLGPLVRTIARNLLVERIRKATPVIVPLGEEIDVADDALEPIDQLVASERRAAVREAIHALSPRHRHVVGMWMEGRTPVEIARQLGIKRNAVDAILHRARRSLAAKLDGGGVLGLVGVAVLRLRTAARRAGEMITAFDPSGQIGPATMSLAAVGLAAFLTVSTPGLSQATPGHMASVGSRAGQLGAAPPVKASSEGVRRAARDTLDGARTIPVERKIAVGFRPPGDSDDAIEIDVAFIRDSQERGVLGPAVEDLAVTTCARANDACRVER